MLSDILQQVCHLSINVRVIFVLEPKTYLNRPGGGEGGEGTGGGAIFLTEGAIFKQDEHEHHVMCHAVKHWKRLHKRLNIHLKRRTS